MNMHLKIEAIKLVELLTSLNIEDFQINQWIFLVDGNGMKAEAEQQRGNKKYLSAPVELSAPASAQNSARGEKKDSK